MKHHLALAAAASLALTACKGEPADPLPPQDDETPAVAPTQSIFAPEAEIEPRPSLLEPLETVLQFGEGGADLSEATLADLATVLASPQMEAGGAIRLGGHSDSAGSDEANLRASQERAEAVRDWLVEQGVAPERITIVAFGEQNPVEPNALADGKPNEQGRAANRRVELSIATERSPEPDTAKRTSDETSED